MGLQLTERNGKFHVTGSYMGVRARESTGFSVRHKVEAHERMREIEDAIAKGEYKKKNVNGFIVGGSSMDFAGAAQGYLQKKRREGEVPQDLISKVDMFVNAWSSTKLSDLTVDGVETWFDLEYGKLKPGSILRYMTAFKAITNHAAKRGWMQKLELPMPHVDDARDEHFDVDEANQFLDWIRLNEPWAETIFTLLIDSGMRLGELFRLKWGDVKAAELIVRKKPTTKTKTRKPRKVPLSKGLLTITRKMRSEPLDFVMRSKKGNRYSSADSASALLNKILKRGCFDIGVEPLRVHDLRHTFAYLAATAGADLGDLQLLMGHERIEMTLRYRGFIPSRALDVIKKLR